MKYKSTKPTAQPKLFFLVTIENEKFKTWAVDEDRAISNAAYRYADQEDEEVGLVRWKIKNEQLTVTWEEI